MTILPTKKAASLVAYSIAALIVLVILTSTTSKVQGQNQTTETNASQQQAEQKTDASNQQPKEAKEQNYDNLPFMQTKENQTETTSGAGAFGLMMRTVGALLLIIGLIVFAGWGLRKFGGSRFGAKSSEGTQLTVLSTVPLGSNRSLAVVRFGERTLLIGSTPQSFTLLAAEQEEVYAQEENLPVRSVSELLKTEQLNSFDNELFNAQKRAGTNTKTWQGETAL